ncbi:helix-turn-helix domain-containing protein [Providencia alcalifaciens]|uniref:helix-turn-helix domain-containing protein n=1 Tax=Providencia TaxID=586 RepID=UPI0004516B4D|nr:MULTISPECIES: helix-turn-helix domain-containing protein [Providencia]EUD07854.1 DNA-binding helix-turn-helix protein [Providencia alcalifaciens R90-1475]MDX4947187.1 helix-turn-helix domain-containing protein [Providencia manganoxydans]
MNEAIKNAIDIVGTQKKLGEACGLTQQAIFKWLHNKAKVSPEYIPLIVKATNGQVRAQDIRPDLPHLWDLGNQYW